MSIPFLKTPVAARTLGIPEYVLSNLIRSGKMEAPAKDSSGDYVWTEADLARARAAMAMPRKYRKGVKK